MSKTVKLHTVQDIWNTNKDKAEAMLQSLSTIESKVEDIIHESTAVGHPLPPPYLFAKPSTGRVALFLYTLLTLPEKTNVREYYTSLNLATLCNVSSSTICRYLKATFDCSELQPYIRTALVPNSRSVLFTPCNTHLLTQRQFTSIVKNINAQCKAANKQYIANRQIRKKEDIETASPSYLERSIEYKLLSCIFMSNTNMHTYTSLVKCVREIGYSISVHSVRVLCNLLFKYPAIERYISKSTTKQQGSPVVLYVGPMSVSKDMLLHLTKYVFSKGTLITTGDSLDVITTPVQDNVLNAVTFTVDEPKSKFAGVVLSASAIEHTATTPVEPEPEDVVEQQLVIKDTGDLLGRALSLYEKALRSSGVTKILTAKVEDTVVLTVSIK